MSPYTVPWNPFAAPTAFPGGARNGDHSYGCEQVSDFAIPTLDESSKRVWIPEGEYPATCTAIHAPSVYRQYGRTFRRLDYAIHEDGVTVPGYVTVADKINIRSYYYRYWTMVMGRPAEPGEPLDLGVMVGNEFMVTVKDRVHAEGDTYSVVTTLRLLNRESAIGPSVTPPSVTLPSITPRSVIDPSVNRESGTRDTRPTRGQSAPGGRRRPGLPPDISALVLPPHS